MEDKSVITACRLVCKSWNEYACQALRKHPRVFYRIEEYDIEIDSNRLTLEGNKMLRLPSPIKKLEVHGTTFKDGSFLKFLNYVRENDNNYVIHLHISRETIDYADQKELHNVLTSNLNNFRIAKLVLSGQIVDDEHDTYMFIPNTIRLPDLKTIEIDNGALRSENVVILCKTLLEHSPLNDIKIFDVTSGLKLKTIMSSGGLQSVQRFYLNCEKAISHEDWAYVCKIITNIPRITHLTLYIPESDFQDCYYNGFKDIVSHFAYSLESLTGAGLPTLKNRCFPKLREICDSEFGKYDSDFSYPVERYPFLKKVMFGNSTGNSFHYTGDHQPCTGIEDLTLKSQRFGDPDLMLKLICGAGMVFPNVSSLSMIHARDLKFTSSMLRVICTSFSKLTALYLWANITDSTLSGLRLIVDKWLHEGWPFEQIPRESSLLDFKGLEKLLLGQGVTITTHLFMHCLSKMRSLRYLTFHLNGDVSATVIRDSVGHLNRITIIILMESMNLKKQWVDAMKHLQKMLPSVVVIKKLNI